MAADKAAEEKVMGEVLGFQTVTEGCHECGGGGVFSDGSQCEDCDGTGRAEYFVEDLNAQ